MNLNERMKMYEDFEANRRFLPKLPVIARLDGKCFHSFTCSFERPYDKRLSDLMIETTKLLVTDTCACIGYTQSDEISLVFYSPDTRTQIFFNGRIAKMTSILAASCTAIFNKLLPKFIPEKHDALPIFDCRVWCVPTKEEAANVLVWREMDATRNGVQMAAQVHYSHKQLMNKNQGDLQELLFQKGMNWNDYPAFFKRGTYIQRRKVKRKYILDKLGRLPPKHNARTNPDLEVERTEIRRLDMPPFTQVTNRVEVIFDGQDPIRKEEES